MRRIYGLVMTLSLALVVTGCPEKKKAKPADPGKTPAVKKETPKSAAANPNTLPEDKAWATGKLKGVTLAVKTELVIPGMGDAKAAPATAMTQTMEVVEGRGRATETTEKGHIPKGTELRYNAVAKKYVMTDPAKKMYWAMTGSQLANVMEGGPELKRSNYVVKITEGKEKEKVAGYDATKVNAEISFDWEVKSKDGPKKGKIKVNLGIWHTADAKFNEKWGDTLIALMAIPFQDKDSQKVVNDLNKAVKFPVKWEMEFVQEGAKQEKGESFPKLVSTATKIDIGEIDKASFQWPPAGFNPATGPYTFGEGGQTATEDDLGKLPAKEGTPPKNVEPVDDKEAKKEAKK